MPTRVDWLPYGLYERVETLRNLAEKIDLVAERLGLDEDQVSRIKEIAEEFAFVVSAYDQNKIAVRAMRTWRNSIMSGRESKFLAGDIPSFVVTQPAVPIKRGIIGEIRRIVAQIKTSAGYSEDVGVSLGITTPNHAKTPLTQLTPRPKIVSVSGYKAKISCQKQGMHALRVEYQRKGETEWRLITVLTTFPAIVEILPHIPGEPESGQIRCIYVKKNLIVGKYSASFPVTLFAD